MLSVTSRVSRLRFFSEYVIVLYIKKYLYSEFYLRPSWEGGLKQKMLKMQFSTIFQKTAKTWPFLPLYMVTDIRIQIQLCYDTKLT